MAAFLGSDSGLSKQRLRGKRYRQLSRDLYVVRDDGLDLRTRVEAVRLVLPDAVPCSFTAALLQNLPVDDDGIVHLARGKNSARSERADVRVHRIPVDLHERLDLDGLPVADGPRTYVDLSARLSFEALVAVGDVLLRRYSEQALREAVDRRTRRPGIVLARRALPFLDGGADSPAETRARLRLHAAGFSALRHGVVIRDEGGGWLAEPDLADEAARIAVQHDGLVHVVGTPGRRRKDIQRDEVSRMADWDVVVSTAIDDARPTG